MVQSLSIPLIFVEFHLISNILKSKHCSKVRNITIGKSLCKPQLIICYYIYIIYKHFFPFYLDCLSVNHWKLISLRIIIQNDGSCYWTVTREQVLHELLRIKNNIVPLWPKLVIWIIWPTQCPAAFTLYPQVKGKSCGLQKF